MGCIVLKPVLIFKKTYWVTQMYRQDTQFSEKRREELRNYHINKLKRSCLWLKIMKIGKLVRPDTQEL